MYKITLFNLYIEHIDQIGAAPVRGQQHKLVLGAL
jgi:hypothetical protein